MKYRDLYGKGEEANEEEWLFYYLSYVGGILEKNYTVSQIQESGLEILKRKKEFKSYLFFIRLHIAQHDTQLSFE